MAILLRQPLYEKLKDLPQWKAFRRDFEVLTGFVVELVDDLGVGFSCRAPLCQWVAARSVGPQVCRPFRRGLMEKAAAAGHGQLGLCDAGAWELVTPLAIGETIVGYLVVSGMVDRPDPSRIVYLLRRSGANFSLAEVQGALGRSQQASQEKREACLRWLELMAREMAAQLTAHSPLLPRVLPRPVERACRWLKAHALEGPVRLQDVARASGVSAAHLSRLFPRSTGLAFTEYVARLRVAAARDLVLHSSKSVTEAAFECGFSSLSQFYRIFRRTYGCSPRDLVARQGGRGNPGTRVSARPG